MVRRIRHILMLLILVSCAFQALGQVTGTDLVCKGTERRYWVVGMPGSIYTWKIDGVLQSSTIDELNQTWLSAGDFNLEVQEHQENCSGEIQTTLVQVFSEPEVFAGYPETICAETVFTLADATAAEYASLLWTSSGDGTFADATIPQPVYTHGPNDLAAGKVTLTVTAIGHGNAGICPQAVSTVELYIVPLPNLVINNPLPTCVPATVDLSANAITEDSDLNLTFTYWMDEDATLALSDYTAVAASGDFYIKATNAFGCSTIEMVSVVVNPSPVLVITDPEPVCEGEVVDLSAAAIVAGSEIPTGATISYWADALATLPLANHTAMAVSGTYYIKATAVGGCFDIESVTITILTPPILAITPPAAVCFPETVDLGSFLITSGSDANLNFTYWRDLDATLPLDEFGAVAVSGDYYIKGTNATGCFTIKAVKVVVHPQPVLVIVTPDAVCFPFTVDLKADAITTGSDANLDFTYWRNVNATLELADPTAVAMSGDYYIRAENEFGCSVIEMVTVVVNPVPQLVITDPEPVCEPLTVDLTAPDIVAGSVYDASSTFGYWLDAAATQPIPDPTMLSQTGTYYIKLSSGVDCYVIQPVSVIVHPQPVFTVTDPEVVCEPTPVDLSLTYVDVAGPGNTYTYWEDAEATVELTNPIVSAVGDRDYYIRAENEFGCFTIHPVHVIINAQPVLVITDPGEVCFPATVDLTSGLVVDPSLLPPASQLTYWLDDQAIDPIADPKAVNLSGIYYIRLEVGVGCYDIEPVEVIIHDLPVVKLTNPWVVCALEPVDLSLASIREGSDPGLNWTYWMDAGATVPLLNYATLTEGGTYYIRGTDPLTGCGATESVNVTIDQPVIPAFSFAIQVCLNTPAPLLPLISTNNVPGTWSPAEVSTDAYGETTYRFTPDAGACALPLELVVKVVDQVLPEFAPMGPYCYNTIADDLPASSLNGVSGSWSPSSISTSREGLTTYTFTPSSDQCASTATLEILVHDAIFATLSPENETLPGLNDGRITVAGQTGGSGVYEYRLDEGSWQGSAVFEDLAPGSYEVWIRDQQVPQCPVSLGTEIISPSGTIVVTSVVTNILCYGYTDGKITYSKALGGSGSYEYNIGEGWVAFTGSFTWANLKADAYTFQLRDANDPGKAISVVKTITQPQPWLVNIRAEASGTKTNLIASISGSGGTPPFTYAWSDGQTGTTAANLDFGFYSLTVTDDRGCKIVVPYELDFKVEAELVSPILCPGGLATIRISAWDGGNPYTLVSDGQIFREREDIFVQVPASNVPYSFTIQDGFGIRAYTVPILVTEPAPVTALVKNIHISCIGTKGQIVLSNIAGGLGSAYQYRINGSQWTAVGPAGTTISNLESGTYLVEIRELDSTCPLISRELFIQQAVPISLSAVGTDALCFGDNGSIAFTFTNVQDGFYTIDYTTGSFTDVEITDNKATVQAPAGTYNNLKLTANDCSSDDGVIVQLEQGTEIILQAQAVNPDCEVPTGIITVTSPVAAPGISFTVTGINPVVAAQTNTTGIFEPMTPGDYEVMATNAVDCNSATLVVTVNPASLTPVDPQVTVLQPTCTVATGTITVTGPVAGISYVLKGTDPELPPITSATGVFTLLAAGEYEIWAVNAQGCLSGTVTETINVQPLTPDAPVAVATQPNCLEPTGTITVNLPVAAAGISYTLTGTNPVRAAVTNTTGIFTGLARGTYSVITTNADACPSPAVSLTITAVPLPPATPVASVTHFPSCNNLDGTVVVVSPLGADLMYSMDGGAYQASTEFDGLKWGDHTIRVKNIVTECVSLPVTVNVPPVPPSPVLTAVATSPKCFGEPGSIVFTIANYTDSKLANGNYTIRYEGGEFKDVRFTAGRSAAIATLAGNYLNLALTNPATGCDSYDPDLAVNVRITQPSELLITGVVLPILLKSPRNGAISLTVTGGTGNYSYRWDNGATTKDIANLTNGSYTVTVTDENGCEKKKQFLVPEPNYPPVAVNDDYISSCKVITGNVLYNDTDPEEDILFTVSQPVVAPLHGTLTLNADGSFVYVADPLYSGTDVFVYVLYDFNKYEDVTGTVTLTIIQDMDGDGVADGVDPDADGDGILNIYEALAGEAWLTADFDGDGLPNWLDIDSDGDGIVDNIESQTWAGYRPPVVFDADSNGVNDAYDMRQSGYEIIPVDTDGDGRPDFLDPDSENDGVPDFIEGHDQDWNGIPDRYPLGRDSDGDGLDDVYDTVFNDCDAVDNARSSNADMQDFDGDGIPDWRDENDDNDAYLTIHEDLNGDGDWSNDDLDYDGFPEYLDYGRECDLFIPNAFSPNGDNIHDYFQIYCINHFPDAKIYIFDQLGNKLYEKANYGNMDVHTYYEDAWWSGKPNTGPSKAKDKLVAPGTYFYVLDLGNGEVKKSFVFVSY